MKQIDFNLKKLKLDSKTVVITYTKTGSDEEIQSTKKNLPHPDMRMKLSKLKPIISNVLNMTGDNKDSFIINGIVLSELQSKSQVMILSQFVTMTGHKISINSHNIPFDGDDYTEQHNIETNVNVIIEEVYLYLFGKKQAQLDLIDESEKIEKEETEKIVAKTVSKKRIK